MAQLDVYRHKGPFKDAIPFVVVVLHPLDMVSVALDQLGAQVVSLAEHGLAIADALDVLLTRSRGRAPARLAPEVW